MPGASARTIVSIEAWRFAYKIAGECAAKTLVRRPKSAVLSDEVGLELPIPIQASLGDRRRICRSLPLQVHGAVTTELTG
jgi:hypothetical protein